MFQVWASMKFPVVVIMAAVFLDLIAVASILPMLPSYAARGPWPLNVPVTVVVTVVIRCRVCGCFLVVSSVLCHV